MLYFCATIFASMATYKKRGEKSRPQGDKDDIIEKESTTAEVFGKLDEGASKTEEWVARNQKIILIIVGVIAVSVLAYWGYREFIQKPKQAEAVNEMYSAQQNFALALESSGKEKDSLFSLSLVGAEGKYGMLDIIDNYGSTAAGNLAHYYAGTAYLNIGRYQDAIKHLEEFEGNGTVFGAIALGAIGDAFVQLNQMEDALEYYDKAIDKDENSFITPRYLYKAAQIALLLNNPELGNEYLTRISEEFPKSLEAPKVEILKGQAEARSQN